MPGNLIGNQAPRDVLIIGAGAAGLAAWHELHSAGLNPVVLDARGRIGGRILTDHSTPSPVELGAEFVHGKPPATWSILEKSRLEVAESSGTRMVSSKEGIRPCPEYWEIIQRVDAQISLTREISYDQFLAEAQGSRFEKSLARSYVEGFNAAHPELISAPAIAVADRAAAEIEGQRQFRLVDGYGSLVDWLATGLPRESLHLRTEVKEIRWQRAEIGIAADTPNGNQSFFADRLIVTVPLGVLRASPGTRGAIQFIPPLSQKEAALSHLEVGHVVKLMISFKEQFWRNHNPLGFAIAFGLDIPVWWTQEPLISNLLTGWAGGPRAEKLVDLSQAELLERAIESLSRIFAKPPRWLWERMDKVLYHNWSNDPFSRGAYSYPKAGGLKAAQILAEPVNDTIYFAGEATDFRGANGTVHAALDSGTLAARRIANSLPGD
jgi:monoamine oxidase